MLDHKIQLQQAQVELEHSQSQLRHTQVELERTKFQLQQMQEQLSQAQGIVAWMQTSKFWQLRTQALKFKKLFQRIKTPDPLTTTTANESNLVVNNDVIPASQNRLPTFSSPQLIPQTPHVLLIVDANLKQFVPQCLHYRVNQKLEQLQAIQYPIKILPWSDYANVQRMLHFCHVVVFYRVPAFTEVINIINSAKALNKIVFYEVDDLIFDLDAYGEKIESFRGRLSEKLCADLLKGAVLVREAMSLCPYAIAATPTLAKKMEEVVGSGNGFVHRNGIDSVISRYLELKLPKLPRDYVSIFYGSGTNTHDADFELVAPALVQILVKHQHVRLTLVGYLQLPEILQPYLDRVDCISYLKIEPYFEFLSQADISIAPLEPGLFADSKSEIKWLEAAMLNVPSVVSATKTFVEVLVDGVDAFIAYSQQDWFDKLDLLVSSLELRQTIAENAHNKAQRNYNLAVMGDNLKQVIACAVHKSAAQGLVVLAGKKQKLLFVNTFYPPLTSDDVAVRIKNIVHKLMQGNEYDIALFTCDLQNTTPYELTEYTQDGMHVTALSVHHDSDSEWRYQDPEIYAIFMQYLAFNQPDLIHFHSVQHLTASMLEAAEKLAIPYVVTVRDTWWLGNQRLVDAVECDPYQNDPIIAARYTDDINNSILRRRYLAKRLNYAKALLASSSAQAELYKLNGFTKIIVNQDEIEIDDQVSKMKSLYKRLV